MFEALTTAGWGDMDFNAHMRNTAYLDKASDVRMQFFAANQFPISEFTRLRIGPVIRRDEVEYFREVHLMEPLRVVLKLVGMSEDGSRFQVRNEFFRGDWQLAARITSMGGWFDLTQRKLIAPPDNLLRTFRKLGEGYEVRVLPSSIKDSAIGNAMDVT